MRSVVSQRLALQQSKPQTKILKIEFAGLSAGMAQREDPVGSGASLELADRWRRRSPVNIANAAICQTQLVQGQEAEEGAMMWPKSSASAKNITKPYHRSSRPGACSPFGDRLHDCAIVLQPVALDVSALQD